LAYKLPPSTHRTSQVPTEEEEDVKYGIPQQKFADGAPLQLQKCNMNTLVQLWYFDKKMILHNLKDPNSVRHPPTSTF